MSDEVMMLASCLTLIAWVCLLLLLLLFLQQQRSQPAKHVLFAFQNPLNVHKAGRTAITGTGGVKPQSLQTKGTKLENVLIYGLEPGSVG